MEDYNLNFDLNFEIWSKNEDNQQNENQAEQPTTENFEQDQVEQTTDDTGNDEPRPNHPERFIHMTDNEIDNIASERTAQSTKYNTVWGIKILKSKYCTFSCQLIGKYLG